jgi:hypothetical protein
MHDHDLDWLASERPRTPAADPGARERALLALIRHTTSSAAVKRRRFERGSTLRRFGLASAGMLAAAAVVAAVIADNGSTQAGNGAGLQPRPGSHHHVGGAQLGAGAAQQSSLVRLADYVKRSATPVGDATLVRRDTGVGSHQVVVYDLYADNGQYFFSRTRGGMRSQVSAHHNLAGGLFAREVAAAKLAATGNVQRAAQKMADAPDPHHVIPKHQHVNMRAVRAKLKLLGQSTKGASAATLSSALYSNWVWEDSQDALIAGSGQPQVRAGVLRILATLHGITVKHGHSGGQATLVLTAGTAEMGAGYAERLTINADSGVPISFAGGDLRKHPGVVVRYRVTRVDYPALAAAASS